MEVITVVNTLGQAKRVVLLKNGTKRQTHLPQVGRISYLICKLNVGPFFKNIKNFSRVTAEH